MHTKKNIFSAILAIIVWLLFNDTEIPTGFTDRPSQPKPLKSIILDKVNYSELKTGKWVVIVEGTRREQKEVIIDEYNKGYLLINDVETASIAARLGVKILGDIIIIHDGVIVNESNEKVGLSDETNWVDEMDYFIFFKIVKAKEKLKNEYWNSSSIFEFINTIITKAFM